MSEKSDKLRAMLAKEKERRIKLNNRIKNNQICLRHPSRKYVSIRMTLILSIKPLSKTMLSAYLNRSISTLEQMDLGRAELFISETRMALSLK